MNEQTSSDGPASSAFLPRSGSGTDVLMVVMGIFLVGAVLWVGTLYWRLHSLPERMAHKSQKLQFEIVAVLGLIWRSSRTSISSGSRACCSRMIDLPDFGTPLRSIAGSVEKIADVAPERGRSCGRRADSPPRRLAPDAGSKNRPSIAKRRSAAMFELMFCSLLTILPDYLYRRYGQGKRFGKEITFFSVWFELRWGITGCLMLTVVADHHDLLFSSLDHQRRRCSSGRCRFFPRAIGPRRGGQCRLQRAGEEGRRALQARQLEAGGRARNRHAQDRRGRRRTGGGARPTSSRPKPRSRRRRATFSRPRTNSTSRASCSGAIPASCRSATSRSCRCWSISGRPASMRPTPSKQSAKFRVLDAAAGGEGQRRGGAGAGPGRSRQDLHSRRRRRARRAVPASRRRRRQSDDAAGRRADPGGRRPTASAGRLRSDRGAGDEGRHGRGGDLHLEAVDDHSDGRHDRAGLHRRRTVPRRRAA